MGQTVSVLCCSHLLAQSAHSWEPCRTICFRVIGDRIGASRSGYAMLLVFAQIKTLSAAMTLPDAGRILAEAVDDAIRGDPDAQRQRSFSRRGLNGRPMMVI